MAIIHFFDTHTIDYCEFTALICTCLDSNKHQNLMRLRVAYHCHAWLPFVRIMNFMKLVIPLHFI